MLLLIHLEIQGLRECGSGQPESHRGHIPKTCGSTSHCVRAQTWNSASRTMENDTGNKHFFSQTDVRLIPFCFLRSQETLLIYGQLECCYWEICPGRNNKYNNKLKVHWKNCWLIIWHSPPVVLVLLVLLLLVHLLTPQYINKRFYQREGLLQTSVLYSWKLVINVKCDKKLNSQSADLAWYVGTSSGDIWELTTWVYFVINVSLIKS